MSENRHIFLKEILFQEGFDDGRYFNYSDVMELKEVYERFDVLYDEMKWGPPYAKGTRKRRRKIYHHIDNAWAILAGWAPGEPQFHPILEVDNGGKGYKFLQWDDV
tara:strand:+ start:329 stop:646 length:318 start_codon:yes stop_codon:yes gene_type:complete